nr:hypothetical protein [Actinomycetales bacterium]
MAVPLIQRGGTRLAVMALGGVSLIGGLGAALALVGIPIADGASRLASVHGPLMVIGFVTTLIALERAVSLRKPWAFAAPACTGLGGILLLTPVPVAAALAVQCVGLAVLVAVYSRLWDRAPSVPVGVQWLGAVLGLGAGLLWLGGVGTPAVLPWIAGYLVLTIAGERLELSHVSSPPPSAERWLLGLAALLALAAPLSLVVPSGGSELVAVGLLGVAAWLFRFDVAKTLVRGTGLPRFAAANMLAAAVWLAVAGLIWLVTGPLNGAITYDAVVHSITLGYAMSMIFGHAPIIFPAVLRRPLPYHPVFWVPSVLLHLSLVVRVSSELRAWGVAWQAAGVLGVLAIVVFALTVISRVLIAGREAQARNEERRARIAARAAREETGVQDRAEVPEHAAAPDPDPSHEEQNNHEGSRA